MRRYLILVAAVGSAVMISACSLTETGGTSGKGSGETEETSILTIHSETEPETSGAAEETESESVKESSESVADENGKQNNNAAVKETVKETSADVVYTVSGFDTHKTMYVKEPVHVRASYTTKSDVLTSFAAGSKVEVTGRSANGWLRISYNGQEAYIYQAYLSEGKNSGGSEAQTETTEAAQPSETVPAFPIVPEAGGGPSGSGAEGVVVGPPPVETAHEDGNSNETAPGGTAGPVSTSDQSENVILGVGPGM